MISKEEAEEKLLKIYYDVKLDTYFKKNPTRANIKDFDETKDPDDLDHWYGIKNDELLIGMFANSYEHGVPYIALQMAFDSAKMWREDFLSRHMKLFSFLHLIILLITMIFGFFIKSYSLIAAILINIIGTGVLIYFFALSFKWKKRVLVRFKELFEATSIYLSEDTFKKYSKLPLSAFHITYFFQCFIVLLISLSWVFALY